MNTDIIYLLADFFQTHIIVLFHKKFLTLFVLWQLYSIADSIYRYREQKNRSTPEHGKQQGVLRAML